MFRECRSEGFTSERILVNHAISYGPAYERGDDRYDFKFDEVPFYAPEAFFYTKALLEKYAPDVRSLIIGEYIDHFKRDWKIDYCELKWNPKDCI